MMHRTSDEQIKHAVTAELRWNNRVEETEIGVTVDNGVVTLTGTVSSFAKKLAAQEATHRVAGVLDVANDIKVKTLGSLIRDDAEIAHAIRHAVTVGERIAPPAAATEPCVRVSTSHGSSARSSLSMTSFGMDYPSGLVSCTLTPLPYGLSIHRNSGVFTAYSALLVPLTYFVPSPRQPICRLSRQPLLFGESLPVPHPVDTCSASAAVCRLCSPAPQCLTEEQRGIAFVRS